MDDKNKQLSDKDIQIAELKEALRLERARGDSVVLTGQIVRDVMQSLHRELLLCSGG
jgi:predicted nucleic acid-binding protein